MAIRPEILLALDKFKDDAAREAFRSEHATNHPIDALVRIRGTMEIGGDREQAVPAAVPWQQLCAVLLSQMPGVDVGKALALVMQGNGKLEAASEELGEAARAAMVALVGGTKRTVRGAVKLKVVVEEITTELAAIEASEQARRLRPAKYEDLDKDELASVRRAQRRTL